MSSQNRRRNRFCRSCRGTSFSTDEIGQQICDDCGALVANYQEEVEEEGERIGQAMVKTRKSTQHSGVTEVRERVVANTMSGAVMVKGLQASLMALQHIFQKQVEFLIEEIGCESSLYETARRIWFAFLRSEEEKILKRREVSINSVQDEAKKSKRKKRKTTKTETAATPIDHDAEEAIEQKSLQDELEQDDPELSVHIFDNPYEGELEDHELLKIPRYLFNDRYYCPTTFVTLGLLYASLVWNREPISICDLRRWAAIGKLPFLDAISLVPDYLDPNAVRISCSTPYLPPPNRVLQDAASVASLFSKVTFPPINVHGILQRMMHNLTIPAQLYAGILNLYESYPPPSAVMDLNKLNSSSTFRQTIKTPCTIIASYIVVAMKLCYGLDDKVSAKLDELTSDLPPFDDWMFRCTQNGCVSFLTKKDADSMLRPVSTISSQSAQDFHTLFSQRLLSHQLKHTRFIDYSHLFEHIATEIPSHVENACNDATKFHVSDQVRELCKPPPDAATPIRKDLPSQEYVRYMHYGSVLDPIHRQLAFVLEYIATYLDVDPSILCNCVSALEVRMTGVL